MTGLGFADNSVREIVGEIKKITDAAVLVDTFYFGEAWIPKRVVADWWFQMSQSKKGLRMIDWEEGDKVILCVKTWFCRKEGLV